MSAWSPFQSLTFGEYFDNLAAVMMVLITFIGLIIVRYSNRYLDGEQTQGRFLRWTAFTIGAVLLFVVSGNLPGHDGRYSLYCAVIIKQVDARTRAKTGINELVRGD